MLLFRYIICRANLLHWTISSSLLSADGDKSLLPPFNPADFNIVSDTAWEDSPGVISYEIQQSFHVTKDTQVESVEYLNELPAIWPVPRRPTAYIVDLQDPKFRIYNENGILRRVDALLKNKVSIQHSLF